MLRKQYKLKGLDLRSSDINRDDASASDVLNVELNEHRELIKRYGLTEEDIAPSTIIDMHEYKRGEKLIILTDDGSSGQVSEVTKSGGVVTIEDVNQSYDTTTQTYRFQNKMNFDEYNGVLYWTDPEGNNDLLKYDGHGWYRAGVPAPNISITSAVGGGSYSYRAFLGFIDCQGNVTYGDYVQFDGIEIGINYTIFQNENGFYERYGAANGNQTINSGNLTLNMSTAGTGFKYFAGDTLVVTQDPTIGTIDLLEIESVGASTITFTAASVGTKSFDFTNLDSIEKRWILFVARSDNPTFGYEFVSSFYYDDFTSYALSTRQATAGTDSPTSTNGVFLEDLYDTTLVKGLPPKCRYISFYNNIMLLANNIKRESDPVVQEDLKSSFYWSDTGVGSTVETFPPFNVDTVGKSSEGEISGIKALSDNVLIGKERQIYYANGNPVLQTFRTRSALTNGIGCVSFKSLHEIEGGVLFMSQRGLYLARYGSKPIELSDRIEPIFNDPTYGLDLTTAITVNDIKNEKLYIAIESSQFTDNIVLVYDYLWKEWFLHRGFTADGGLAFVGDTLFCSNDNVISTRNENYVDTDIGGTDYAIEAYYKTNWFHEGFPSIVKKWLKFIVLSIGNINWTCNIKTQHDWVDTAVTDENITIDSDTRVDDHSLNMKQTKAMRLEIGNNVLDEGMLVTGYEYEFEYTQERPKGDD